ncbi:MAG TPA: DUF4352 domain-containing protein [Clostridium sp.]
MSKLTNCKACKKEIAKGVKKCPSCGKDQRNFFGRHKIVTGIIVLAVIGIIGSTGNSTTAPVSNSKGSVATSAPVTSSTPVVKDFYAVGEAVKSDDTTVTVIKVKKTNGGEYDKAKSGMEFVVVTVLIKNGGTNEITYNPFDFKMQNSKGQITDMGFTTVNTDTALQSGSLASKGEITGTIAFEQPKNDKALVLKYSGSLFSSDVQIKLN